MPRTRTTGHYDETPAKRDNGGRFVKGTNGGPGAPKRQRRKYLTEDFFRDLHEKWLDHGVKAIDDMIAKDPTQFVKTVAALMPREFTVEKTEFEELPDEELATILGNVKALVESGALQQLDKRPRKGDEPVH